MADETFSWANGGADIHLIAGNPYEIGDNLLIFFTDGRPPQPWSDLDHRPSHLSVTFKTGSVTFTLTNQGVAVQEQDEFLTGGHPGGHVSSESPPGPSPRVRNFIVTATVSGTDQNPLSIRVFVHDSLEIAQLSPSGLSIPAGQSARFSVLALFSDGAADGHVAADLSRIPFLTWAVVGGNTDDVSVVNGSFRIEDAPSRLTQLAIVQVTLPETLYPVGQVPAEEFRRRQGTVTPIAGWARDVQVEPIGDTQGQNFNDARNILFLPDGFKGDDGRTKFNRAMQTLAGHLRTSGSSRPFSLFIQSKKLNLFKAWIDSPESGSTALSETAPSGSSTDKSARVPIPIEPPTGQTPSIRTLQNLLWRVGLPTNRAQSRDFQQQKTEWGGFFGPINTPDADLEPLWNSWRLLFPRYLAVEKDTALGIRWGRRPQISITFGQRDLDFNSNRTDFDDINPLLERLHLENQAGLPLPQRIGARWAENGADHGLIVVIVNGPVDEGTQDEVAISTLADFDEDLLLHDPLPDDGAIVDTVAAPIGRKLSLRVRARVAHEIGHSFGLGDEYAEGGLVFSSPPAVNDHGNLHSNAQLMQGTQLRGERIRWGIGWKRIRAAGLLAELPEVRINPPFSYTIRLRPGHGDQFKDLTTGTRLRFRRRPLIGRPPNDPFESLGFSFRSITGDRIEAIGEVGVDEYIEFLVQSQAPPDTVLLFAARVDDAGNELGLMHQRIAEHITATNSPLNRPQSVPCTPNFAAVQTSPNVPSGLLPSATGLPTRFLSRVLGLYDGGAQRGCGVYHPRAMCLMRRSGLVPFQGVGIVLAPVKEPILAEFCPVCRYILVDEVDPTLHKTIDAEYDSQYPRLP